MKLTVIETWPWGKFIKKLRTVTLLGDKKIFPYKNASVSFKVVGSDVVLPISKYVLAENLKTQKKLHETLLKQHSLDTLHLNNDKSTISYKIRGDYGEWLMSPPVVEISKLDGGKAILLDGEHRFVMARKLKQSVGVVWIEGVDKQIPPIAKPISWNEVNEYNTVPELAQKRVFRYPSLKSFPDISSFSNVKIDKENFRYFYYRDLSPICNSFVRKPSK